MNQTYLLHVYHKNINRYLTKMGKFGERLNILYCNKTLIRTVVMCSDNMGYLATVPLVSAHN